MLFEGIAWADEAAGVAAQSSQQMIFGTVVPLALLFGVFYFMLIRPQTKKAQDHDKMVAALKRGDEVVLTGGIVGRIAELGDQLLTVEVAPNVRIRVERQQVTALSPYGKQASKKDKAE
ncbi:MAG TPA: preprotein translocase subunit YajC [Candidatus Binataceae bacterium]|nr:preprotein translocase subunit YajC [Candidatus Binataceae bacterium]